MNDTMLRQMILDQLEFEPSVDAAHIGVAVDGSVVSLTGHVRSYAEKLAAEQAVRRVRGVRAIAEGIEVRLPDAHKASDDEIAQRVLSVLSWHAAVPQAITAKVEHGWVQLTGSVDWQFERQAAEAAVRRLSGIVGVCNDIQIKTRPHAPDVKRKIEDALRRSIDAELTGIHVAVVDGGSVTLEGRVHTHYQRTLAERAAWSVPGVQLVDDRLMVAA
jgi:osmotically-inducible protein OsmY